MLDTITEGRYEYKEMKYSPERKVEILCQGKYKNYQFYILNLGTHPTAYVEIPRKHKLFEKKYEGIDIDVHGGLTFSEDHLQDIKNNSWFIGWDYAHFGDFFGTDLLFNFNTFEKKWTTEEIFDDVVSVIDQLEVMCYE